MGPIVLNDSEAGQLKIQMGAAYAHLADLREENFALWMGLQAKWVRAILGRHNSQGFAAPQAFYDEVWSRLDPPFPHPKPGDHIALLQAFGKNYEKNFIDHWRQRHVGKGNVCVEITGPTGMGKSSCAMHLADILGPHRLDSARLREYLVFDMAELPEKLASKKPGETVIIDEYVRSGGEGSRTMKDIIANVEDTIRASQVNLLWLSPQKHDHGTSQMELELFYTNWEAKAARFLVWMQGKPFGYIEIPWVRKEVWDAYSPWKAANVERSLLGQFRESRQLARLALGLFQNEDFAGFLLSLNKPKKGDFDSAVGLFGNPMWPTRTSDRLVSFLFTVCYAFERLRPKFNRLFGVEPNQGWEEVAKRCYAE